MRVHLQDSTATRRRLMSLAKLAAFASQSEGGMQRAEAELQLLRIQVGSCEHSGSVLSVLMHATTLNPIQGVQRPQNAQYNPCL